MATEPAEGALDPIEIQAAQWLARRDRGFRGLERAEFEEWLECDPRHGRAVAGLTAAWSALDRLRLLAAASADVPDADLLRRPARRRIVRPVFAVLAAAAALALGIGLWRARPHPSVPTAVVAVMDDERHVLPDGSVAELDQRSAIEVRFTAAERRLELTRGQANFSVTKNAARPFLVRAGGVVVRAVGTVFSVRLRPDAVEVLVSEGKVRVASGPEADAAVEGEAACLVTAGQRAILPRNLGAAVVENLSHEQVESLLAWRSPRLVFAGQPLSEVAAQFNRYNRLKLEIADPATGRIPIGGSFRANQVNAFVRLLDASSGVRADFRGDRIVLCKEPADTK